MKTRFYGGDAQCISYLNCGDIMTTNLIDKAITELIPLAYILKEKIEIELTDKQLMQIKPTRTEIYAMIYFLPVRTYKSNKRVQEARLTCGEKTIKIYTTME